VGKKPGRKATQYGVHRMSFSFSRVTMATIRDFSKHRGATMTHFVQMAVHQYARMLQHHAWMCPGNKYAACNHLNSQTAEECEICGAVHPDVELARFRAAKARTPEAAAARAEAEAYQKKVDREKA